MPPSSNIGQGLDAIRDAIGMYFGLRQQKFDRQRQAGADARAEEELQLQRAAGQRAQQTTDATLLNNKQKFLGNMAENYGGQVIPRDQGDAFRSAGMGMAVEPQMTLGARRLPGAAGIPGVQSNTMTEHAPQTETGSDVIRPTASERLRIGLQRDLTTQREGALNRASRSALEQMRITQRGADNRVRQIIASNANALQRYGINVRNESDARRIASQVAYNSALLEDREFDNKVGNGLAGILSLLNGGGPPQAPDLGMPNYFAPGGGSSGAAPSALGDWEPQ